MYTSWVCYQYEWYLALETDICKTIYNLYFWILLRSYDTLYRWGRWHLLGIGQTKIIYYNLPDITEIIEKKLIYIEYVPILIIPAYYK